MSKPSDIPSIVDKQDDILEELEENLDTSISLVSRMGNYLVEGFHLIGLFIIGIMVVWAGIKECMDVYQHGYPLLKDILLLFIYLEIGAMLGIYFKTHELPVQFFLYIAITALTRVLVVDIKEMSEWRIMALTIATLLLVACAIALRYAMVKFPGNKLC